MGDCCSSCNGEKENKTEMTMRGLTDNRLILVVDVEDDNKVIER